LVGRESRAGVAADLVNDGGGAGASAEEALEGGAVRGSPVGDEGAGDEPVACLEVVGAARVIIDFFHPGDPLLALLVGAEGGLVGIAKHLEGANGIVGVTESEGGVGGFGEKLLGLGGEFRDEDVGEAVGEIVVDCGVGGADGEIEEVEGAFAGVLLALPIEEATALPVGEVLFINRPAAEYGGEDLIGFIQTVEPVDKVSAEGSILDAGVEFVANVASEACDFNEACCHIGQYNNNFI
jgi:hypothetical protein